MSNIWSSIKTSLDSIGYISTIIVLINIVIVVYAVGRGIAPVLWRLGKGLHKRKIAVFATTDEFVSLRNLLLDSKLFLGKNIKQIPKKEDFDSANEYSVFLVYYPDFKKGFSKILKAKKDSTAMIVYAPKNKGLIPDKTMEKIGSKRNSMVTNFRGRLMNDIVISMITTSYRKEK